MRKETVEKIVEVEQEDELDIGRIKNFARHPSELEAYRKRVADKALFSKIILLLTHNRYEEAEAERFWKRLKRHMERLEQQLGRSVGINVAAMDYMENIVPRNDGLMVIAEDALDNLASIGTKDELTGLFARDVFEVFVSKHFEESKRDGSCVAYAMFDIDDFKQVNDTYGHQRGDEVLRSIGEIILNSIRDMDLGVRYGGEELGVIFPSTDEMTAKTVCERIRRRVEKAFEKSMQITVSCGIADSSGKERVEALIEATDRALYRAKEKGKNRIETA